jgi:hypothetical protein
MDGKVRGEDLPVLPPRDRGTNPQPRQIPGIRHLETVGDPD